MIATANIAPGTPSPTLLVSMALMVRRRDFDVCHGFDTTYAAAAVRKMPI
jgi:hypothetical protein